MASISNFAQQNNLDSISNWTKKGTFTLLFNQASFSNWIAGGENAVSGTVVSIMILITRRVIGHGTIK
jgi:hypothetical protein